MAIALELTVFPKLFAAVAEEMGIVLRRSAFSPNIKERRGDLAAQLAALHRGQERFPALAARAGLSGVHTHMTNTRNTPVEVLEHDYPVLVERYALRQNSGGAGEFFGGDGLVRDFIFSAKSR